MVLVNNCITLNSLNELNMNSFKSISRLLCLSLLILIVACKNDKPADESFFSFEHHIKNEGFKPVDGDLVSFRIQVLVGDSIVQTSDDGSVNRLKIPVNSEASYKINPLFYAFKQMADKDSATLIVKADSLETMPLFAKAGDQITYHIVIDGIQSGGLRDMTKEQMDSMAAKRTYGESAINAANRLNETISNWGQQDVSGSREIKTTSSGIEYLLVSGGSGALPKANEWITYNYVIRNSEGMVIANTFRNNRPVNSLSGTSTNVRAIDELLTLIPVGATVVAKVPAALGFKDESASSGSAGNQSILLEIIRTDPYDKAIQQ